MSRKSEPILVAYYSHSGNTCKIATLIHQAVGGTLHEIQPEVPYPKSYNAVLDRAKQEIKAGYHPPLQPTPDLVTSCDIIFVGTPNWWSTIAPPIATFLSEHDLSGKTIIPFCTHGGGGLGRIDKEIRKLCPHAAFLTSFKIYGSGGQQAESEVSAWLHRLGMND